MINSETKLRSLVDYMRKDAGINNAIDAMEQLSLILLHKYFYDSFLVDTSIRDNIFSFKSLFFRSSELSGDIVELDFSKLRDVVKGIASDLDGGSKHFKANIWSKVQHLSDIIPLKIKSAKTLETLLSQLDGVDLDKSLADDYDKLVIKMINESLSAGAFHSPRAVVSAIVKVVNPSSEESIYDPAMGTGQFFIEVKNLFSQSFETSLNESWQAVGKDISSFACLVGTVNLLLNGIDVNNISLGNSLLEFDDARYNIILCGVPFGKPPNNYLYEENHHGAKSSLEAMFLEHAMKMLAKGGKAALIVPDNILFSGKKELIELRDRLLTKFNLHTILDLPSGTLAPYSGIKVSVIFFDNTKPEKDIWFYKVTSNKPIGKNNQISEYDLMEFTQLFSKRVDTKSSCLINKQDILNRDDLSLTLDLPKEIDDKYHLNILEEITILQEKKEDINLLMTKLMSSLSESNQAKFDSKITLGKLFAINSGNPLNSSEILEKGLYPVYGANGVVGYFNEYNREGDNVLIGRVGAYCGNVHFVKDKIWVTGNAFSLDIRSSEEVYLPYLAHVLRSLNLNKLARGSAQPSISYSSIKDVEVYLPTYDQQVELSEWFERVQQHNLSLQKELDAQKEKVNELTEYAIFSNCINDSEKY